MVIGGFVATLGGVITSLLNHYLRARREDMIKKKKKTKRGDKLYTCAEQRLHDEGDYQLLRATDRGSF